MKYLKAIAAFVVVQVFLCFIAWLGGFNFDERNWAVAWLSLVSVYAGVSVSLIFVQFYD